MSTASTTPAGVMDASYARGRVKKLHLAYRLRVRAFVAAEAFKAAHGGAEPRVLDLGCAEGRTLLELRGLLGARGSYLGIEFSDELLASAPELPEGVELVQGDVTALPPRVEPGHFNLATCMAVLEHLTDPLAAVQEAYRALEPGGLFVASCPHPFWDHVAGLFGMVEDEHHEDELDRRKLVELCRRGGFETVQSKPFMWAPTGVLPYVGFALEPEQAAQIDNLVAKMRVLDFTFVNQLVVAQKAY